MYTSTMVRFTGLNLRTPHCALPTSCVVRVLLPEEDLVCVRVYAQPAHYTANAQRVERRISRRVFFPLPSIFIIQCTVDVCMQSVAARRGVMLVGHLHYMRPFTSAVAAKDGRDAFGLCVSWCAHNNIFVRTVHLYGYDRFRSCFFFFLFVFSIEYCIRTTISWPLWVATMLVVDSA